MSVDYYAEARYLAELLKQEGLEEWAGKVLNALDEGVTATEILMMLRWNIGKLLATQAASGETSAYAKSLYQKIDTALA